MAVEELHKVVTLFCPLEKLECLGTVPNFSKEFSIQFPVLSMTWSLMHDKMQLFAKFENFYEGGSQPP